MLSHVNWKIVANVLRDRSALCSGSSRPRTCRHGLISQYAWVFATSLWELQIQRKLFKHLKNNQFSRSNFYYWKVWFFNAALFYLFYLFFMFLYDVLFAYLLLCLYLWNYLHIIRSMWRSLQIAFSYWLFIASGESYCYSVEICSDFVVIKTLFQIFINFNFYVGKCATPAVAKLMI